MKNYFPIIPSFLLLISFLSFGQNLDKDVDLLPLRESEKGFIKKYRILKTTLKDKSLFITKYKNTNMNLDYVLRYYFYTGIEFSSQKNQLISMDGTVFDLESESPEEITNETIELISGMFFGRIEFKSFNNQISK